MTDSDVRSSTTLDEPGEDSPRTRPLRVVLVVLVVVVVTSLASLLLGAMTGMSELVPFALLGAAAAWWLVQRPGIALGVVFFVVFSGSSDVVAQNTGVPVLTEAVIVLAVVAHVIARWGPGGADSTRVPPGLGAVLAVVASAMISLLWAGDRALATSALRDTIIGGVLAAVVGTLGQRSGSLRAAVWGIVAAGLVLGGVGCLAVVTGDFANTFGGFSSAPLNNLVGDLQTNRLAGPMVEPNFFAQRLVLMLPFALYMARCSRGWARAVAVAVAAVTVVATVFTYSRGGLFALGVVLVWFAVDQVGWRRTAVALVVVGALAVLVAPATPYLDRVGQVTDAVSIISGDASEVDPSLSGRASEGLVATRMFSDHPTVGVGIGNFPGRYLDYSPGLGLDPRREARAAHSLYLQVLAEQGLVGMAAWAWLLGATFALASRARHDDDLEVATTGLAVRPALVGFLVTGIFLHLAFEQPFWLVVGLAAAAAARHDRSAGSSAPAVAGV